MRKNVGRMDAYMRITCGVFGVAWGTAKMAKNPRRMGPILTTMMASMKIAEGITRFCPMLYAMGIDTLDKKGSRRRGREMPSREENQSVENKQQQAGGPNY